MLNISFHDIGWAKVKVLFLKKCEKLDHKKTPPIGRGLEYNDLDINNQDFDPQHLFPSYALSLAEE